MNNCVWHYCVQILADSSIDIVVLDPLIVLQSPEIKSYLVECIIICLITYSNVCKDI